MRAGLETGRIVMGDISAEPSMEEILSSIKRIIAEEGEGTQARQRRPQRTAQPVHDSGSTTHSRREDPIGHDDDSSEEVLELSDPMPPAKPQPARFDPARSSPDAAEPIVSQEAAAASRGSLETLSKLLVKPDAGSDGTLEGLVREMLRPMLRDWLDANLPALVESLVAREIERIVGQAR